MDDDVRARVPGTDIPTDGYGSGKNMSIWPGRIWALLGLAWLPRRRRSPPSNAQRGAAQWSIYICTMIIRPIQEDIGIRWNWFEWHWSGKYGVMVCNYEHAFFFLSSPPPQLEALWVNDLHVRQYYVRMCGQSKIELWHDGRQFRWWNWKSNLRAKLLQGCGMANCSETEIP